MTRLLILGAAGTARDVIDWLPSLAATGRAYECIGLLDDDPAKAGTEVNGCPVLGGLDQARRWPDVRVVNALGGPKSFRARKEMVGRSGVPIERFETLIHPLASVSPRASIGAGCLIYPFAFVGPDVTLGGHVTVLSHSAINHDGRVGVGSILASHVALAGAVSVGEHCYIGMGASVIQGAKVGAGAMVGMGSVVIADVAAGATVAGNPARSISTPHR